MGALILTSVGLAGFGAAGSGTEPGAPSRPEGTLYVVDRREDRVLVVDALTGRTRTVRPPGLARCGTGLHVSAGWLVYVGYTPRASVAYAVNPDRPRRRTKLGGAHELVPSRTPGRVWLAAIPRCRNVMSVRSVHEVTVHGRVTFRSRRRVPGIDLIGAVDGGLVLQRKSGELVAWDPVSGRTLWRQAKAYALATAGRFVAWCPLTGCARGIRIADLQDAGRSHIVRHPTLSFEQSYTGALAPDGSLLAVPAKTRAGKRRLALADTETGRVSTAPGSRLDRNYPLIAWAPGGWVFFNAGSKRIMAYRPAAEAAVELPIRLPRALLQMAAGS